jgi:LysR family transcriptional regulator, glycine cleavage system transcriptional activator
VHTPFGYYFLCRPDQAASPRISALRDFLVAEAAMSAA